MNAMPAPRHCTLCGCLMQRGRALVPTLTGGVLDFPSDAAASTLTFGGPGQMVDCWKCPSCGHSIHA